MKRLLAAGGVVVVLLTASAASPYVLRGVDFFRVRQIEMVGLHYVRPAALLDALRLDAEGNLFDDAGTLERRAMTVPGVEAARIERRLPGTLRLVIAEREPVALAPGPEGMVALDGRGSPLPYDPSGARFDLPVVPGVDRVLLASLAMIRTADAELYGRIDAARRGGDGSIVLELGDERILLAGAATPGDVRSLQLVRRRLRHAPARLVDARFSGWIVVRRGRG